MSLRVLACLSVVAGSLSVSAASAAPVVFDFGSGVAGGPVGVSSLSAGGISFTVSASGVGTAGTGEVSLFDPDNPVHLAADPDMDPVGEDPQPAINTAFQGVRDTGRLIGFDVGSNDSLILQENNDAPGVPDDSAGGGTITFTLAPGSSPVRLRRMTFVDDVDAIVSILGIGPVGEIDIGATTGPCGSEPVDGDNCVAGLDFTGGPATVTQSFSVAFDGSGGVLGFEVEPVSEVPLPAGLPLLLTALGLFGWLRHRGARG